MGANAPMANSETKAGLASSSKSVVLVSEERFKGSNDPISSGVFCIEREDDDERTPVKALILEKALAVVAAVARIQELITFILF